MWLVLAAIEAENAGMAESDHYHQAPPRRTGKGRGATLNPANRYAGQVTERERQDVPADEFPDDFADSIATEVRIEVARTIISRNQSPDVPFSQSINMYRGCEHVIRGVSARSCRHRAYPQNLS